MTPDPLALTGRFLRLTAAPEAPPPVRTLSLARRARVGTPDGPGRVADVLLTLDRRRVFVVVDLDDGEQLAYAADEIAAPPGGAP